MGSRSLLFLFFSLCSALFPFLSPPTPAPPLPPPPSPLEPPIFPSFSLFESPRSPAPSFQLALSLHRLQFPLRRVTKEGEGAVNGKEREGKGCLVEGAEECGGEECAGREEEEGRYVGGCDEAKLLVWEYVNNGLGCEIHWLQAALTLALSLNRTLVVQGHWVYAEQEDPYCQPYTDTTYLTYQQLHTKPPPITPPIPYKPSLEEMEDWERREKEEERLSEEFRGEEYPNWNFKPKLLSMAGSREGYMQRTKEDQRKPIGHGQASDTPFFPKTAFDCYLSPLSSCSFGARERREVKVLSSKEVANLFSGTEDFSEYRVLGGLNMRDTISWNVKVIPEKYQSYGLLWWRAQLSSYIMRPNERVKQWLAREETLSPVSSSIFSAHPRSSPLTDHSLHQSLYQTQNQEPVIAAQIRRGDKIREAGLHEFEHYHKFIEELSNELQKRTKKEERENGEQEEKEKTRKVFLASDDQEIKDYMKDFSASPAFLYDSFFETEKKDLQLHKKLQSNINSGGFSDRAFRSGAYNVTQETLNALRDLFVLSECDALITTFSSNFGRLAYEMMVGRSQEVDPSSFPPAISLDRPRGMTKSWFQTIRSFDEPETIKQWLAFP